MTPDEIAAQALAELESKSEAHLAAVRAHAAAAKSRLEQGLLNLRTQAETLTAVEPEVAAAEPSWDFGQSTTGSMPQLFQSCARDHSMANSAGWV